MMPSMNRSMSVPDTGSMWDMHTSASQPSGSSAAGTVYVVSVKLLYNPPRFLAGGEASLWDITMNPSTQGPTMEQLQKVIIFFD